ncbi:MAG: YqgE/AlgH family protein [Alphaproteobacteria bacterium]|nr:YqgE/AlgH family protein [Alphaproteobacteria bacterium]
MTRMIRTRALLAAAVLSAALCLTTELSQAARQAPESAPGSSSLQGRFLVAKPSMADPRFKETVILMIKHDATGAFGLVINRPAGVAEISDADPPPGVEDEDGSSEPTETTRLKIPAFYGGPVELHKAFVIHSVEYQIDTTVKVTGKVAVTADPRILEDIANGQGPKQLLYVLGYSGWRGGQLENELRRNDWYTAPVDADIVFDKDKSRNKWRRAVDMRLQGI